MLRMREASIPLIRWRILKEAGLTEPLSKPIEEVLQMYMGHAA